MDNTETATDKTVDEPEVATKTGPDIWFVTDNDVIHLEYGANIWKILGNYSYGTAAVPYMLVGNNVPSKVFSEWRNCQVKHDRVDTDLVDKKDVSVDLRARFEDRLFASIRREFVSRIKEGRPLSDLGDCRFNMRSLQWLESTFVMENTKIQQGQQQGGNRIVTDDIERLVKNASILGEIRVWLYLLNDIQKRSQGHM